MIQAFITRFEAGKPKLVEQFSAKHPGSYMEIVKAVIEIVSDESLYDDSPDPNRIHEIDDGDYQGTLLYVIGAMGYQPSDYWYVKVWYGSCSGCDTLQGICDYSDEPPTPTQVAEYMTLALHVVQGLKKMAGWGDDS